MLNSFNPCFQVLRRHLFKNYTRKFNKICERLENEIDDLFCVIARRGNTKFINDCSIKLLGQLLSNTYQFIFHEMYGLYVENLFSKKIDNKMANPAYLEFPIRHSNGKYVWLRLNFHLIELDGELLITIIAKDITTKRALLEEFGEYNLHLKSIFENIKLGIIMEDTNRTITSVNKKLMEIFQIDANPKDFIGINCEDAGESIKNLFMEPAVFRQTTERIIAEKKDVFDEIFQLKNGRIVERSFFTFKSDLDENMCLWTYNDVTENRRLHNILTEKQARYRGIVENTQLGILEADSLGNITNASQVFCQMTGFDMEELVGTNVTDGLLFDKSSLAYFNNLMENYNPNTNLNNSHELQLNTRNNSKLWVLVSVAPTFNNNNNKPINYTGFYIDITERKNLEQSLRTANEASKKAEESEKLFLASMTHELKTPINAIVGMGDLLKLTTLNEEQIAYVEILDTSTKYLQKLISDILDMSKIESGLIEIKKDPFNLMNLLRQIARPFVHSLAKNDVNLKIELDFCPNLEILGDKIILQQIIGNLLSNAEKFTQKGSITLLVKIIEETVDNIRLLFVVKDTGIGFDPQLKDLIFNKFTQLPSINHYKSPGIGLGLSIVKQLLAFYGSKIKVNTKMGEGSEFSFDLSFQKNQITSQIVRINAKRNFDEPFNGLTVLVAEDDKSNLQYLSKVLKKWSINFDIANSGEEALKKFNEKEYNLVLLDIQLPDLNGFEIAEKLRLSFQNQLFTIIAMTAVVTMDIEREILMHGMNDILKKPFSIDELYDKIASCYSLTNSQSSTQEIPFHNSLDTAFLHQFYGNDYDFALSVFETFRRNYFREFKEIIENADNLPPNEIDYKLHRIKPSFKMIGMTDVEKEIEDYLSKNVKHRKELKQIFYNTKMADKELILSIQIALFKERINTLVI